MRSKGAPRQPNTGVHVDARQFLTTLVGQELTTITGKPNRVLAVQGSDVLVGTTRSPKGKAVPLAWVQEALDRLETEREVEISVASVRFRSAFVGAVLKQLPGAAVVPGTTPPRIRLRS
jgi:hypothetical protein